MSAIFSEKCDLCGVVQTEENHSNIRGVKFSMNGVTKFACLECKEILDGAFTIGKDGLRDPMKMIASLTKERDQLLRLLQQAGIQKETGNASLVGVEVDHLRAQKFNALGMDKRFQPAGPALEHLPAPMAAPGGKLGYKGKSKKK